MLLFSCVVTTAPAEPLGLTNPVAVCPLQTFCSCCCYCCCCHHCDHRHSIDVSVNSVWHTISASQVVQLDRRWMNLVEPMVDFDCEKCFAHCSMGFVCYKKKKFNCEKEKQITFWSFCNNSRALNMDCLLIIVHRIVNWQSGKVISSKHTIILGVCVCVKERNF